MMDWKKFVLNKTVFMMLISFIVSLVICCIFFSNWSGRAWGIYKLWSDEYSPLNVYTYLILGVVGLFFGILLPFILKVKNARKIIKMNISTGVLSILFYILIILLINWNYFVSDRQHYWGGNGIIGCINDLFYFTIVIFYVFGIALIIGFLIGGIGL